MHSYKNNWAYIISSAAHNFQIRSLYKTRVLSTVALKIQCNLVFHSNFLQFIIISGTSKEIIKKCYCMWD